MARMQTARNNI